MSSTRTILAVPGLAATSPAFRAGLWELADRNGWDADAIAAVIASESGFEPSVKNPLPGQTATGLLQWIDSTARKVLGLRNGVADLRAMTREQQLPLVEKFYRASSVPPGARPVDYYLAGWGSGIGKPLDHVLARESDERKFNGGRDNLYTLNRGLDADGNGEITVADIAAKVAAMQAKAKGQRLDASAIGPSGAQLLAAAAPALLALGVVGAALQWKGKV